MQKTPPNTADYWVYILNCENGHYYTGYTTDITRRYQEHCSGTGKCKYTRSFKPLGIAQCWQSPSKSTAMKMEKFIKQLSRENKKKLLLNPEKLATLFDCKLSAFNLPEKD